jgi:hypothetical protein
MARTTVADEDRGMKPRVGAMFGCPYGQEAEFSVPGLTFFGQDFFWTIAGPLAEFEVPEEAVRLTAELWKRFLKSGALSPAQRQAAAARDGRGFLEAMRAP